MLFLISLGVNPLQDLTLSGLEAIDACDKLYLETYTSPLPVSFQEFKSFLEAKLARELLLISVDRSFIENQSSAIIEEALTSNVGVLVVGDALTATTHYALVLEANSKNVDVKVIHSTSIFNVIARIGLDIYKFGRTTTLVTPKPGFNPESPFKVIKSNMEAGLHSLVLLDPESLTVLEALKQLKNHLSNDLQDKLIIACSRLSWSDETIIAQTLNVLLRSKIVTELKKPSCIVIPGALSDFEREAISQWLF